MKLHCFQLKVCIIKLVICCSLKFVFPQKMSGKADIEYLDFFNHEYFASFFYKWVGQILSKHTYKLIMSYKFLILSILIKVNT